VARRLAQQWLQALLLGVVLLAAARVACAEDFAVDEEAPRSVASNVSLVALARESEASPSRGPLGEKLPVRLGKHVVVRVALVDIESHPDSGSVNMMLRSRLLGRPIARAPLALSVAWRF
jgi:hypothetical protein